MQSFDNPQAMKRSYTRITLKTKKALVKLVLRRAVPLEDAIIELGLKRTTAVNIINRYKKTGLFPARKYRKKARNVQQKLNSGIMMISPKIEMESSQHLIDDQNGSPNQPESEIMPYHSQFAWMYYPVIYYLCN